MESDIQKRLLAAEDSVREFFAALSPNEFIERREEAWSPAEHLSHLNIATSAVARGFGISRWLFRLRFGRSKRASRSFEELRDAYRARLAAGGRATGGFVPATVAVDVAESEHRRRELLARWARVNGRLRAALQGWSDKQLDTLQLPHPLLGKITAREMLYFTIYHDEHHIAGAKKRLGAS